MGGVTGYTQVGSTASDLMSAINQQPVSVAVEADESAFQRYSGGIVRYRLLRGCCAGLLQ